jgi:hypothetical protein
MKRNWRLPLIIGLAVGMLLVLSLDASAQCSMCRAALSGTNNKEFLRSFNTGVLVLLLPPVSIFCSIFIILRKHSSGGSTEDQENPER